MKFKIHKKPNSEYSKTYFVLSLHSISVKNGKSSLGFGVPTEPICNAIMTHNPNQAKTNMVDKGGKAKTYGVDPMKLAVHFMTAIPILMFFQLQRTQKIMRAPRPQTTYDPYR